jgi:caffeoyl-CoA O-methyltransferase|tara:strand:- start:858 stop:1499 length:642 start_codon:yes stop_codon:yes gene_type:complete
MDFLPKEIDAYSVAHTAAETGVLNDLNRQTNIQILQPRMLSGHLQGRVLSMLSHMIQPTNILEIGTYTGYSAICLAEGLKKGGKVVTIDRNAELEDFALSYFEKANVSNKIDFRIGNAIDIIPSLKEAFDLVFIDADKTNYSNYFDLVIDKLPKGAYIIADNVLWSGKVVQEVEERDMETKAIVEYNQKIQNDSRVENVLFPIRDGLMIARKL